MQKNESYELMKSILKLQGKLENYDRKSAIELIKEVRKDHPGIEEIVCRSNGIKLEDGTDKMIIDTLEAEKTRLEIKLNLEK